jgi:hypothetical protein
MEHSPCSEANSHLVNNFPTLFETRTIITVIAGPGIDSYPTPNPSLMLL